MWFRRDLRLHDHPALLGAVEQARSGDGQVLALYVVDPRVWAAPATPRLAVLARSLTALDEALDGRLVVRHGDPLVVVPEVAAEVAASAVHVSLATDPYGRRRDAAVEAALGPAPLVATGSPYALDPGLLRTRGGGPYQVFTPFRAAWLDHGWPGPAPPPARCDWARMRSDGVPSVRVDIPLPEPGETAARRRWAEFAADGLADYAERRDRPDLDATSHLSTALAVGELHPRTVLADLAGSSAAVATFRSELAWREFHADVLWHHPEAAQRSLRDVVAEESWADGEHEAAALAAWTAGRTGYPLVDAGMRQLLGEGFVHNRVRMVVASFLVKDLHVRWQRGAAHFLDHLVDADLANNQLNWQWVAGTGYDAAPYHRVFNPVTQAHRFDPDGDYVRRWVPELREVPGSAVHEPWRLPDGPPAGYPGPIVDHAVERKVALAARR